MILLEVAIGMEEKGNKHLSIVERMPAAVLFMYIRTCNYSTEKLQFFL